MADRWCTSTFQAKFIAWFICNTCCLQTSSALPNLNFQITKYSIYILLFIYCYILVYIPVPVGQAIGPPLDGWR